MKRSADLPLTIRPVVGMDDSYPAGYVDVFHSHDRGQLSYALSGVMSVVSVTATPGSSSTNAARSRSG